MNNNALASTYALLKKIEEGIVHKSNVEIRKHGDGIEVIAWIKHTKHGHPFYFSYIFTYEEMRNTINETVLIDRFINLANKEFRRVYANE